MRSSIHHPKNKSNYNLEKYAHPVKGLWTGDMKSRWLALAIVKAEHRVLDSLGIVMFVKTWRSL